MGHRKREAGSQKKQMSAPTTYALLLSELLAAGAPIVTLRELLPRLCGQVLLHGEAPRMGEMSIGAHL